MIKQFLIEIYNHYENCERGESDMKKKGIVIFLVIVFMLVGSVKLYMYITSSHGTYYSSVNEFIDENGREYFVDMYNPKSYFNDEIKKEKISKINRMDIYYNGDAKDGYSINYKNILGEVSLGILINRLDVNKKALEDYTKYDYDHYQIYVNESGSYIQSISDDYSVILEFENLDLCTEKKLNILKEKGIEIIKDIYVLNMK